MKDAGHEVHPDLLKKGEVAPFHPKGYISLHQGVLFHLVRNIPLDDPFLHQGTGEDQPLECGEGHLLLRDTEDILHFDVDRGLRFDVDRGLCFDVDRGLPFGVDHDPLCVVGQGLQVDAHQCDTDQGHLLDVDLHFDVEHHLQRNVDPLL